jgi:uncharacterized membrane protein
MTIYQESEPDRRATPPPSHYHGDVVRVFMVIGGALMSMALPFFTDLIPVPIFFSVLAILILVVLSGLLNPQQKWLALANAAISGLAFLIFEYHAILALQAMSFRNLFFIVNQLLAFVFFIATYYATKTARGMFLKH